MKQYKISLTRKGREIYKGGNIEPMSIMLFSFRAENEKQATNIFDKKLRETLGSAMESYFKIEETGNENKQKQHS